jgi:hypothetical protein
MKTAKLKEAIKRHIQYWTKNEDNQTEGGNQETYNIVQRMKTTKLKEAIKTHTILDKE